MSFLSVLVPLVEMKVIKWFLATFCTPRPGIASMEHMRREYTYP